MTKVNCVIFSFPISSESILTGLRQGVIQKFGGQHSCSPSFFDIKVTNGIKKNMIFVLGVWWCEIFSRAFLKTQIAQESNYAGLKRKQQRKLPMTIRRYEISDEQWDQMKEIRPKARTGRPPKDN